MSSFLEKVEAAAKEELDAEKFREMVEKKKTELRNHVPLLHKIFPFKIVRR